MVRFKIYFIFSAPHYHCPCNCFPSENDCVMCIYIYKYRKRERLSDKRTEGESGSLLKLASAINLLLLKPTSWCGSFYFIAHPTQKCPQSRTKINLTITFSFSTHAEKWKLKCVKLKVFAYCFSEFHQSHAVCRTHPISHSIVTVV